MRATSVYVDHAILSMLLAMRRRFAALYAERRSFRAGGMGTTSVANVDHAIHCMLLAIRRLFTSVDIVGCPHCAEGL